MVIEEGILNNSIPEIQEYFLQRGDPTQAEYRHICAVGTAAALAYIKLRSMEKAKQLLAKMVCTTVCTDVKFL